MSSKTKVVKTPAKKKTNIDNPVVISNSKNNRSTSIAELFKLINK